MVNPVERAARKHRPWGKAAAALLVLGVVSLVVYAFVWQANADAHSKHPCPIPPVPGHVQALWWLTAVLFAAALVCLAAAAVVHWRTNKAVTVVCVLAAALTVLPLVPLADTYDSPYGGRLLESPADPLICDGDRELGAG